MKQIFRFTIKKIFITVLVIGIGILFQILALNIRTPISFLAFPGYLLLYPGFWVMSLLSPIFFYHSGDVVGCRLEYGCVLIPFGLGLLTVFIFWYFVVSLISGAIMRFRDSHNI